MTAILQLPRTLFAAGAVKSLRDELRILKSEKPILVTDRGVTSAGLVSKVERALGDIPLCFSIRSQKITFLPMPMTGLIYIKSKTAIA